MLINRKFLAKYSPYPVNYDLTEVMQYVDISEVLWIIPLIGYAQYNELCDQVKNNNLTPENSTLLTEVIYPLLGFCIAYESLPLTWSKITEVGIVKNHSDTSEPLTLKDMTWIQEHLKRQIQARGDYAIQWIGDRIEYFPLIAQCKTCKCCTNDEDLYKPKTFQQLYSTYRKNTNLK